MEPGGQPAFAACLRFPVRRLSSVIRLLSRAGCSLRRLTDVDCLVPKVAGQEGSTPTCGFGDRRSAN